MRDNVLIKKVLKSSRMPKNVITTWGNNNLYGYVGDYAIFLTNSALENTNFESSNAVNSIVKISMSCNYTVDIYKTTQEDIKAYSKIKFSKNMLAFSSYDINMQFGTIKVNAKFLSDAIDFVKNSKNDLVFMYFDSFNGFNYGKNYKSYLVISSTNNKKVILCPCIGAEISHGNAYIENDGLLVNRSFEHFTQEAI